LLLGSLGKKAGQLFLSCPKLFGDYCIVARDLFLRCFNLLAECRIVADYLFLDGLELFDAGFELLDFLLDNCKETAE
jgi:hypothetical protein